MATYPEAWISPSFSGIWSIIAFRHDAAEYVLCPEDCSCHDQRKHQAQYAAPV
jgi:hypothetical protein